MKFLLALAFTCCISMFYTPAYAQPVISFTTVISSGLTSPMQLVHAGDGSKRIFIVQKGGTILVYKSDYTLTGTFLTVSGLATTGEQGLLSMAFHPNYAVNGLFYVYYCNSNGDLELARYKVSANADIADAASKVILLTIPHPGQTNHNGGELHFGNDGYLYLATGDGGGGGDVPNNAQTTSVLLGKMLRLAVNTSTTAPYYTIPADNPYGNEVYAYGLRNPFRWSFDKLTYDMWISDVGQDSYEEINFRPHDSTRNINYGWHCYEGDIEYDLTGCNLSATYTYPVYEYATPDPAGAITGGTVYRGNKYISMRGYYIATDFFTGDLYLVKHDSVTHTNTTIVQTPAAVVTNIADFGETEDGELYAVSLSGVIYRVVSNGPVGYTFTGNGNWNISTNWSENAIPPATLASGNEIIIDPVANGECVLNITQTIAAGAKCYVKDSKKFRIPGNLIVQ